LAAHLTRWPVARRSRWWALAATIFVAVLASCGTEQEPIAYSELKQHIDRGDVASVVVGERRIVATPTEDARATGAPAKWRASPARPDPGLIPLLERKGVRYDGEGGSGAPRPAQALLVLLAVAGIAGLVLYLRRNGLLAGIGSEALEVRDVGKRARGVRYADVAGIDEVKEELEEVVAFLKHPERFAVLGARAPKGVLLVGPPGTGKTLLARATAGEAEVPFYSVSASSFVEMFVGVGARRIRKLFEKARSNTPCIVFIDELDAVGKGRSGGVGSNDEREQTLNQLLVELDGFDSSDGIVVMAATNRPEILDAALLRPGRFDRRITVNVPDRAGRLAILDVHARGVRLGPSVDLGVVARSTPGFAGADLANLLNEAALLAARAGCEEVREAHLDAAIDRVLAGAQRKGQLLNEKERRIVAVHETGHAIVAERSGTSGPVRKISIVPRTVGALGFTQQLSEDRSLLQRDELIDRLRVLLAGRAAEEVVFGQVSTGAANDLERATALARRMVCEFGMSATLGPVRYGGSPVVPSLQGDWGEGAGPSAATAADIDREVRQILEEQAAAARATVSADRKALDAIAGVLLEKEDLDRDEFVAYLRRHGDCSA